MKTIPAISKHAPIYLPGKNNEAVLMLHGWSASPLELKNIAQELNKQGYTIDIPLLKGHGTSPQNLNKYTWTDWYDQAVNEYDKLKKNHKAIHLIGASLGGNLSFIIANKLDVNKIVTIGTPYKFNKHFLLKPLFWLAGRTNFNFPKSYRHYTPEQRKIVLSKENSYQQIPTKALNETIKAVDNSLKILKNIKNKILVIGSTADMLLAHFNSLKIDKGAISSKSKIITFDTTYHLPFTDPKYTLPVAYEITNFLAQ